MLLKLQHENACVVFFFFFFFFNKKRWDRVMERDRFLDSRQKHLQILLIFAVGSY